MTYRLSRLVAEELASAGCQVSARDGHSITSDAEVGFLYLVVQDCRQRLGLEPWPNYVAWRRAAMGLT